MTVNDKKTLRNIIIFSLIVLSCGWVGRLVDLKATTDASGSLGQLIWIVSPILAMIILRTFKGDGWKDLGIKPRIKNNVFLYLVSILFFPIISLIIILLGQSFNLLNVSNFSPLFFNVFALALIPNFIKNIFEEFAWRGYLTPKLFSLGYNRLFIHIYVGVIWAVWHIPYLLILTDTTENLITLIPLVIVGLIVQSIVYGEIRLRTKSVWPAVIMHTMGNAFVDSLIIHEYLNIKSEFYYLVTPSPDGVLAILITAIVGIGLYKMRMIKQE